MSDEVELEKKLSELKERLNRLSIYELRQIARAVGVDRPAVGKKERLSGAILDIASGAVSPVAQSKRGAPPKSCQVDEELVAEITRCRIHSLGYDEVTGTTAVSDSLYENRENNALTLSGIFNKTADGYFVLCDDLTEPVFVHESFVERFALKEGTCISFRCTREGGTDKYGLTDVFTVNGEFIYGDSKYGEFETLTHIYPEKRIYTGGNGSVACRICDMFAPLALGQRVIISAPAKSGKTLLLKEIAEGVSLKYPEIEIVLALIGEQPEVVNDFVRSFQNIKVFHTLFTQPSECSRDTAALAVEYAKRNVERGKDVIILFDGITRLYRAYRNSGRAATGLDEIKSMLGSAINAEEGGSLTLVSTLSSDELDVAVSREFLSSANMIISLSQTLAENRIFPAIDILKCGADREEKLLTPEELATASALRNGLCKNALTESEIIRLFKCSGDNGEIIARYKNG